MKIEKASCSSRKILPRTLCFFLNHGTAPASAVALQWCWMKRLKDSTHETLQKSTSMSL